MVFQQVLVTWQAIYLSKNNYDKYNEAIDEVYQISIFLKNSSTLSHQTIKKLLEKDGYNAVSPSMDGKETNVISLVYGMMLTITLLVFFLSSTLILYFVLSFSIKSRLNDVEILRTIGAKQKDIKNMMVFELSFVGLISYLIILVLSLIIKYNTVGTEIYQLINSIGVIHHLIVVVLVLTICVSASIMLTDKMFKKTVKKSLDQR